MADGVAGQFHGLERAIAAQRIAEQCGALLRNAVVVELQGGDGKVFLEQALEVLAAVVADEVVPQHQRGQRLVAV